MFDFFDYNFSSLISIFAALMGMAYPLILQAIQRIDDTYNSTKLATFFQNQWFFRLFSGLLLLTIPVSVVLPFLLHYYCDYNCIIIVSTVHTIVVFALAISAFILFKYIMMTTNPFKFLKYLKYQLNGVHPPLTEIFQIAKYASDKDDDELFKEATEIINIFLIEFRKNKRKEIASEVWNMLRELLKEYSKRDNHFFSTRNLIVNLFFPVGDYIELSEEEYNYIWQTIDAVIHTDNDAWVIAYWTYADQYYRLTLDNYSDDNKELQWQQVRFKEQHFMLGALLAYNHKYELLNQLMYFTNTLPPKYVLVPSSFKCVISQLKNLIKMKNYPINLTKRYLMISAPQDVSSDDFILRYAYKYSSLLLIRLFTVNNWNITYSNPMDLPEFPNDFNVEDLNGEVYMMNKLKENTSFWFKEKNAINQTIGEDRVTMEQVLKLCNDYISQCNNRITQLKDSMVVDPEKLIYLKSHLLKALKEYSLRLPILNDANVNDYKKELVRNYIKYQIDKDMLKVGTSINCSNLPDVIVERLNELAYKAYNYIFLLQSSVRNVRIAYSDIKCVLDEIGVTKDFVVISLGVYLGNYECRYGKKDDERFVEHDSSCSYKGCQIYSIPSNQQSIVVMKKYDMPFIMKEKLTDCHNLDLIDKNECFYSNINQLQDLSLEKNQFLYVNRGIYIYKKEQFKYIRLNIDYNPGFKTDMNDVNEAREIAGFE